MDKLLQATDLNDQGVLEPSKDEAIDAAEVLSKLTSVQPGLAFYAPAVVYAGLDLETIAHIQTPKDDLQLSPTAPGLQEYWAKAQQLNPENVKVRRGL